MSQSFLDPAIRLIYFFVNLQTQNDKKYVGKFCNSAKN